MAQKGKFVLLAGLAVGCVLNSASAALLDFTDEDLTLNAITNGYEGMTSGIGFTLTSLDGTVNFDEDYDGNQFNGCLSGTGPLECDTDGTGIDNDELTGLAINPGQTLSLVFATEVVISGFHFLDLYVNPNGSDAEQATVNIDGTDYFIGAGESSGQGGYAHLGLAALGGAPVTGQSIIFSANPAAQFWDDHNNDYAFAAIDVSPVPVPAAVWLFGTALIGLLGYNKRRKAT